MSARILVVDDEPNIIATSKEAHKKCIKGDDA